MGRMGINLATKGCSSKKATLIDKTHMGVFFKLIKHNNCVIQLYICNMNVCNACIIGIFIQAYAVKTTTKRPPIHIEPAKGYKMSDHRATLFVADRSSSGSGLEQGGDEKRSSLVSRNVTVNGHRTSIRLEPPMWEALSEICRREKLSIHQLASMIADRKGDETSFTAAVRVLAMTYFRAAATEEGHSKAGHGSAFLFSAQHDFAGFKSPRGLRDGAQQAIGA